MSIQRYDKTYDGYRDSEEDGDWVTYEDHEAEVATWKKQATLWERSVGQWKAAYNSAEAHVSFLIDRIAKLEAELESHKEFDHKGEEL